MITTKITANFNISNLANNFDKVVSNVLESSAKDSEEQSKMNIDNSRTHIDLPMKPLASATKKVRDEGYYWEGKTQKPDLFGNTKLKLKENLVNIGGDMPLLYTGNLYKSIKARNKTLSMEKYGEMHNKGYQRKFGNKTKRIPARPFIEILIGDRTIKEFKKQIKKYLKK